MRLPTDNRPALLAWFALSYLLAGVLLWLTCALLVGLLGLGD